MTSKKAPSKGEETQAPTAVEQLEAELTFRQKQIADAWKALAAHDSCQCDDQVNLARAALSRPFTSK